MTRFGYFALATTLVACTSSSSNPNDTPLAAEDYDDTAQAIASATASTGGGDVASMADSTSIALGIIPLGFIIESSGHVVGQRFGLKYSYAIECRGVGGERLAACNDLTDRADVDVSWSGTLDTQYVDADVAREGSWSIQGLQSDRATFDGDSSFDFDATLRSVFRPGETTSLSFDASASYDAVVLSTQTLQAIDGAAAFDLAGRKIVTGTDHDVDKAFSVHADVEFHADSTATLTLDDERRYTINTATGVVIRAN